MVLHYQGKVNMNRSSLMLSKLFIHPVKHLISQVIMNLSPAHRCWLFELNYNHQNHYLSDQFSQYYQHPN